MEYIAFSECGNRWENQDSYRIKQQDDGLLLICCDGMAHHHGLESSETVCNAIVGFWEQNQDFVDCEDKIRKACKKASEALNKHADELSHAEMGTTMVMASIEGDKATIAYSGDSRCYLLRPSEGLIYQTKDHIELSFGWEVLTNSFFSYRSEKLVVEVHQFELQKDDRLFLCTDGVYKSIKPKELISCLLDDRSLEEVANKVKSLCERNMDDNYTGILFQK